MTTTLTLEAVDMRIQFGAGGAGFVFHAKGDIIDAMDTEKGTASRKGVIQLGSKRIEGVIYATAYTGGRFIADDKADHKLLVAHSRKLGHTEFQVEVVS